LLLLFGQGFIAPHLHRVFNFLINFVFPKNCFGCEIRSVYLCADCTKKLEKPDYFICPFCLRPAIEGAVHSYCQRKTALNGAVSLFSFCRPLSEFLHVYKYQFVYSMDKSLDNILKYGLKDVFEKSPSFLRFLSEKPVCLAVPLYWQRQNWRGFNQSDKIALLLAKKRGLKLAKNVLWRTRDTTPQAKLKKAQRLENIKEAFCLNPGLDPKILQNKKILLVDDIWTTGATLNECAKILKKSKVGEIWSLTIAR